MVGNRSEGTTPSKNNIGKLMYKRFTPNLGLSLNRKQYIKIRDAYEAFCEVPDYNWDLSLTYLSAKGFIPISTLSNKYPYVTHIGTCGTHSNKQNCEAGIQQRIDV